jgi:hypothetical protein
MPPLPTVAVLPTFPMTQSAPPTTPLPTASPRPSSLLPTPQPGPTLEPIQRTETSEPTQTALPPEPDRIWLEQPLGDSKLVVWFFTEPASARQCIRFTIDTAPGKTFEQCPISTRDVIVGLQSVVVDSHGKDYTVITGRLFTSRVTAVSLELDHGDNTPAQINDAGFIAILPGKRTAFRAIPIDQFGNLAGPKYVFR